MSATPAFVSADPAPFNPESGRLDAARIARELNFPVGAEGTSHAFASGIPRASSV